MDSKLKLKVVYSWYNLLHLDWSKPVYMCTLLSDSGECFIDYTQSNIVPQIGFGIKSIDFQLMTKSALTAVSCQIKKHFLDCDELVSKCLTALNSDCDESKKA